MTALGESIGQLGVGSGRFVLGRVLVSYAPASAHLPQSGRYVMDT